MNNFPAPRKGDLAPARAYSNGFGGDPKATYKNATDPAARIPGMPPNLGEFAIPHVVTFQGILSSVSRVYRYSDEAMKHSFENARFMLNDLTVRECIDQRRRSVGLLNWHLEPEDENDARQKQLCADLTDIIDRIPNFKKYRESLSLATWFGRYANQHRYRWQDVKGTMRCTIDRWKPVHGDKLVFRYDDGTQDFDPDQIGIRVGAGYQTAHGIQRRWSDAQFNQVQPTDYGLAYFLNEWERPLLALHRHLIEDGEYEDPQNAGRVQGLGIRSIIYWTWYQKQETLAWLVEYLERSALGIEIWKYPLGNANALKDCQKAAEERIGQGRNIVFVPVPAGDTGQYDMQVVEPGMAGAEAMERIVKEYFGHLIKRYILGQTMTTESANAGLGSNLGEIHLDTYMQIIRSDATDLEETLTTDLVRPLQTYNFPQFNSVRVKFCIDTEAPDVEKKLQAWKDAYDMGMELKEQALADLIGAPKAEPGDTVLQNPEAAAGRNVKSAPGAAGPGQPADFKGRSQVSMMGQDFIELMRTLQNKQDAKQLGQELGAGQPERFSKDASGHEHAPAGSPKGGEFVSKGGGAAVAEKPTKKAAARGEMSAAKREGKGKDARIVLANGEAAPSHIKPSMVPPQWTDVQVATDPAADVLVRARDAKGRLKTVYSANYEMQNAAANFARVRELIANRHKISEQNQANRHSDDPKVREAADCLWLIEEQATRPGSDTDTKAKVKAYGATTLLGEHVEQDEDGTVRLHFIGKEGVEHNHVIRNRELAKMLVDRKRTADDRGGRLFATSDNYLRDYTRTLDGGAFTPKNFRTAKATVLASEEIKKAAGCCKDKKEYKAAVKQVATVVSGVLGNRPQQAVESYIDPTVWSAWQCPDCHAA